MDRAGELPLGTPLPTLNAHAITVSVPKWAHFIGYQEGDAAVLEHLLTGYPRFVVHALIVQLSEILLAKRGRDDEACMLFPVASYAEECRAFLLAHAPTVSATHLRQELFSISAKGSTEQVEIHAIFFPNSTQKLAKQFWQHTGLGISSRLAQRCLELLEAPAILPVSRYGIPSQFHPGHRPLPSEEGSLDAVNESKKSHAQAGHVAPFSATQAKVALRKRIADCLSYGDSHDHRIVYEDDVFLYQTGMTAIWHVHQLLMALCPKRKFVCFGFPYTDTLKILEKWGPGCHFFGHDLKSNMDALEALLSSSQDVPPIAALFCEIPSNPRLESPPLDQLRVLADKYDFLIVVDDTVGSWMNVNVLPYVDIIVSSLSKFVCGYATAMGGSVVINPRMRYHQKLKTMQIDNFRDVYFEEDIVVMEQNSRDFTARMRVINANTKVLCEFLRSRSLLGFPTSDTFVIKEIFYPKWISREEYDICRVKKYSDGQAANDNFGGLFSLTFVCPLASHVFLDALSCAKGPSLGTNFTLVCPYTILAHYAEREWAAGHGVDENLIRVSVGIESQARLLECFEAALRKAEEAAKEARETT